MRRRIYMTYDFRTHFTFGRVLALFIFPGDGNPNLEGIKGWWVDFLEKRE